MPYLVSFAYISSQHCLPAEVKTAIEMQALRAACKPPVSTRLIVTHEDLSRAFTWPFLSSDIVMS